MSRLPPFVITCVDIATLGPTWNSTLVEFQLASQLASWATEWYYYCQEPPGRPTDHINVWGPVSLLLLIRSSPNFKIRLSLTGYNCHGDNCPCIIYPGDNCIQKNMNQIFFLIFLGLNIFYLPQYFWTAKCLEFKIFSLLFSTHLGTQLWLSSSLHVNLQVGPQSGNIIVRNRPTGLPTTRPPQCLKSSISAFTDSIGFCIQGILC